MIPRLGPLTQGRANNIQLLRLVAAACVVLFHRYALTGRWTSEPLWKLALELNFGMLGVKCFFVLSGFLVTQGWLARRAAVAGGGRHRPARLVSWHALEQPALRLKSHFHRGTE